MNFYTTKLLNLISSLLFISSAIAAEGTNNIRKNNQQDNKNDVNVIVKINDEEGKNLVVSRANTIRSQIDRLGIMSITTSYDDMIFLRNDPNIERVEIDYEVSVFGQRSGTEKKHGIRLRLHLWESLKCCKTWNSGGILTPPTE